MRHTKVWKCISILPFGEVFFFYLLVLKIIYHYWNYFIFCFCQRTWANGGIWTRRYPSGLAHIFSACEALDAREESPGLRLSIASDTSAASSSYVETLGPIPSHPQKPENLSIRNSSGSFRAILWLWGPLVPHLKIAPPPPPASQLVVFPKVSPLNPTEVVGGFLIWTPKTAVPFGFPSKQPQNCTLQKTCCFHRKTTSRVAGGHESPPRPPKGLGPMKLHSDSDALRDMERPRFFGQQHQREFSLAGVRQAGRLLSPVPSRTLGNLKAA